MRAINAKDLIRVYKLEKHPEGGYFRESYRAAGKIAGTGRNFSTAIYFLLPAGEKSWLHRLKSDEVWHFYLGGALELAQIFPDGRAGQVVLGRDALAGQKLQHAVPAGCWFGACPDRGAKFSFVGCTVAPGFEFPDFELGDRAALLKRFPRAGALIKKLT
ncbi:MAG: cupin domain-containing protein [Elusimicrobia bacterium]|nr:cupin domain-containing protein [Elusimicrobiota bacterium]